MTADGAKRVRRAFLVTAFVGGLGSAVSFNASQYRDAAFYAFLLLIGLATACVYHGFAGGYVEARRGVDREIRAARAAAAEAEDEAWLALQRPCEIVVDPASGVPGYGHIYVIAFSTGTVKVGQTADLYRRFKEHVRAAEAYGVAVVNYWVSPPHANYLGNEIELISFCDGYSARSKREYFHDMHFETVVEFAEALTFESVATEVGR
jgi:hypothetical protein